MSKKEMLVANRRCVLATRAQALASEKTNVYLDTPPKLGKKAKLKIFLKKASDSRERAITAQQIVHPRWTCPRLSSCLFGSRINGNRCFGERLTKEVRIAMVSARRDELIKRIRDNVWASINDLGKVWSDVNSSVDLRKRMIDTHHIIKKLLVLDPELMRRLERVEKVCDSILVYRGA